MACHSQAPESQREEPEESIQKFFTDPKNQLPDEELVIGDEIKARTLVKELKAYDTAIFYNEVRKFFERLRERLFHYLSLDNNRPQASQGD